MRLVFVWQATAELSDAIDYYEQELPGLGERFWEEVDKHLTWILAKPALARLRPGNYRRVNLKVFPYYIPYALRGEAIVVLAIAHVRQLPVYWIDRQSDGIG